MEDAELKDLLESYNHKLEEARVLNLQSWVLNFQCFESIQTRKAKSKLKSLLAIKIVGIILGLVWVLFLGFLIYYSLVFSKIFFVISVGMILLFSLIAIIVYIKHIILINKIIKSDSVIKTQEEIARLQLSTINIVKILFLQTPFYCTFSWSFQWIENDPASFWLISFPITLAFTAASIWLYKNISYKNVNKKWFKILFRSEWTLLAKANTFLTEIENFKKDI